MSDPTHTLNARIQKLHGTLDGLLAKGAPRDGDGDGILNEGRKPKGGGAARRGSAPIAPAGGGAERVAAVTAYSAKNKTASQHWARAVDAAEKGLASKDKGEVKRAITTVLRGRMAQMGASTAAKKIPYPGKSSPWERHDALANELGQKQKELARHYSTLTG